VLLCCCVLLLWCVLVVFCGGVFLFVYVFCCSLCSHFGCCNYSSFFAEEVKKNKLDFAEITMEDVSMEDADL